MKKLSSRLSIIAALVASQALAIESSQVTLPLDKYLELIKKPENPSQTMIYSAQLSGDYKKSLNLKISGAAMGKRVVSDGFLAIDQRYALEDCKGTALLQVKDGQIALFPKADRFDVECRVRVEKWDDLQIIFSNVLSVSASVKGVNSRTVALGSLQTRISFEPPLSEIQPVIGDISVVARYRITILPEAQRFQYHLDLTNPNRATKAFEFALVNGESIQRVAAPFKYDEKKDRIIFYAEPGQKHITIDGTLIGKTFKPALTQARQYLMIENHPNLTLDLKSAGRRISASDAGMRESFTAAKTFLLEGQQGFSWEARKLEIFYSPSLAVSSADYRVHVPLSGKPMVLARYNFENRGVPELPLEVPGTPLYLEVGGQPQVLTKDKDGKLLIQMPTGSQNVYLQYSLDRDVSGAVAGLNATLAKPQFLISNVSVSLGADQNRQLVMGRSLESWRSLVSTQKLITALLLGLCAFVVFQKTGRSLQTTLIAMWMLGGFARPGRFTELLLLLFVVAAIRNRQKLLGWMRGVQGVRINLRQALGLGALALVAIVLLLGLKSAFRQSPQPMYEGTFGSVGAVTNSKSAMAPPAARQNYAAKESMARSAGGGDRPEASLGMVVGDVAELDAIGSAPAPLEEPVSTVSNDWQGLPAPISVPEASQSVYFSQQMLEPGTPIAIRGLTVQAKWAQIFSLVVAIGLGLMLYRRRDEIRRWLMA
jgi:hypothetical protein